MAVGVRVVTTSGRPSGGARRAFETCSAAADLLPIGYIVGVFSMALFVEVQRLGDLVAGTMVVATGPDAARQGPRARSAGGAARASDGCPITSRSTADERGAIELSSAAATPSASRARSSSHK